MRFLVLFSFLLCLGITGCGMMSGPPSRYPTVETVGDPGSVAPIEVNQANQIEQIPEKKN